MIAMLDTLKEENNKSEKKKRENKPNNKKGVLGWRQQHNNHYAGTDINTNGLLYFFSSEMERGEPCL